MSILVTKANPKLLISILKNHFGAVLVPNLIRVFSYCNRSLIVSRQLLSSQSNLKSHNFVTIANNLHLKYKSLTSVSFSASSSPDDIRIKSKGDDKKKRRRIISSSSSDDNEKSSPNKSADDSK